MSGLKILSFAAALAVTASGISSVPATADVADFYRGKTVTVTVAGSAGASLGLYCRLVVAHWGKHIPGNPNVICQFRPGAGGTKAAAYMYNAAPKDGTVVGEILSPSVLAPVLRKSKFDSSKFVWIGSVTPRPSVVTVWHTAPATTVEGAKKAEVIMGSTGFGSETYLLPMFMNAALGTKFKIVRGYKGGAPINKAMEVGEVHGRMNYWSGWTTIKGAWLRDKKIVHLVQYGPMIPEIPEVPHLRSLLTKESHKQMLKFLELSEYLGMGFYLPPGVPRDRIEALRDSFFATLKDPEFLADAKKRKARVEPISGAEIEKMANAAFATPEPVLAELRDMLGFNK
jgi:tripartite-type tricarboxylate transporter receptor subunit TctC